MHKIKVRFSRNLARFAVSLFTGERIEIEIWTAISDKVQESPSLRGSGLKCSGNYPIRADMPSPSLRGSGLKSNLHCFLNLKATVSLFTGERIEIDWLINKRLGFFVSLFTGERIEIRQTGKSIGESQRVSLFTGERIEIASKAR